MPTARSSPSGPEVAIDVAATGDSPGYSSFEQTANLTSVATTVTFSTPDEIPPGNLFLLILDGGGGSGAGGAAASGGTSDCGGGGSGAGGVRRVLQVTRAQFIELLPVVVTVPARALGGIGGVAPNTTRVLGGPGVQGGAVVLQSAGLDLISAFGGGGGGIGSAAAGGGGGSACCATVREGRRAAR